MTAADRHAGAHDEGPADVVIVGGGIVGLATAWRAAQRGLRTVLLERDELGAATSAVAAGMLAPVSEAEFGETALLELGMRAARGYPALVGELAEASSADPGYRRAGTLIVARDRDEAEVLDRLHAFRRELELPVERLLPSRARRLEPALAPALRLALHAPDDHTIDPRRLSAALATAARGAGADLRPHAAVARVTVERGRVTGVELEAGERLAAAAVVIAAGPWSGGLPGVPDAARLPVRPVKGQLLRLRDPAGPGLLERTVRFGGGYLVPRGDGRYVLGATVEERGFDTSVTAGAVHDLLRDAAELVPGVLELEVERALAGLRPGTPDNAPALGRSPAVEGLVWATGHHRNGILLGPLSGEVVAGVVAGGDLPGWAATFSPARFADVEVPA